MVIGTFGIKLFGQDLACFRRNRFHVWAMLAPGFSDRNQRIFGVDARGAASRRWNPSVDMPDDPLIAPLNDSP
jgi:hypothetical protein